MSYCTSNGYFAITNWKCKTASTMCTECIGNCNDDYDLVSSLVWSVIGGHESFSHTPKTPLCCKACQTPAPWKLSLHSPDVWPVLRRQDVYIYTMIPRDEANTQLICYWSFHRRVVLTCCIGVFTHLHFVFDSGSSPSPLHQTLRLAFEGTSLYTLSLGMLSETRTVTIVIANALVLKQLWPKECDILDTGSVFTALD